jgi:hypothetical protein
MRKNLVLLVVLLGSFVVAHAGTVTFDDVNAGDNDIQTHVVSDGYNFDSDHFHIINNPGLCSFGGCVSDGTQYLAEDAPGLAFPVTMTQVGGGSFSLVSFDGDKMWLNDEEALAGGFGNAQFIHVVGNFAAGGQITEDFFLDGSANFQHFDFAQGWTGLESVIWSGSRIETDGDFSMAVDNISTSNVPEPGSLLLLGSGLVGLTGLLRRKVSR